MFIGNWERWKYDLRDPLDKGYEFNGHNTFRRRRGRVLNVLCVFNLRPVSKEGVMLDRYLLRMNLGWMCNKRGTILVRWSGKILFVGHWE